MRYEEQGGGVILTDIENFNINDTLLCGQVFRFKKRGTDEYFIIAGDRGVTVKQNGEDFYFFPCDIKTFEGALIPYFDLRRDYAVIKDTLSSKDDVMRRAVSFGGGIRILNQDRFETLISFIISQNKQIKGIQRIIGDMALAYGRDMGGYSAFPSVDTLARLNVSDFAALKTGFRAAYLADAVNKVHTGAINLYPPSGTAADTVKNNLMTIKGVGPKVASCVMLFSFGMRAAFPVDVWVLRALQRLYFFDKKISLKEAHAFAFDKFGEYGGYAQQYLFHYIRNGGI